MKARRKQPSTIFMWAVVIVGRRAAWINYDTIAATRKIAFNTYCDLHQFSHETEADAKARSRREIKKGTIYLSKVWVGVPGRLVAP